MYHHAPAVLSYTIRAEIPCFLARRFNTTVDAIMMANRPDPMNLQVGRIICIPTASQPGQCPGGFLYQIVAGDTYFSLARRFNTTVEALIAANPGRPQ